MKYILAIDQGTTSTRAILFDNKGRSINSSQREFCQICPKSGWVLHNPLEIMETVYEVIKSVLNQESLTLDDIETIGVTNQRETTVKTQVFLYFTLGSSFSAPGGKMHLAASPKVQRVCSFKKRHSPSISSFKE